MNLLYCGSFCIILKILLLHASVWFRLSCPGECPNLRMAVQAAQPSARPCFATAFLDTWNVSGPPPSVDGLSSRSSSSMFCGCSPSSPTATPSAWVSTGILASSLPDTEFHDTPFPAKINSLSPATPFSAPIRFASVRSLTPSQIPGKLAGSPFYLLIVFAGGYNIFSSTGTNDTLLGPPLTPSYGDVASSLFKFSL